MIFQKENYVIILTRCLEFTSEAKHTQDSIGLFYPQNKTKQQQQNFLVLYS